MGFRPRPYAAANARPSLPFFLLFDFPPEDEVGGGDQGCALAGSLSKGLCYVNRKIRESSSIQASPMRYVDDAEEGVGPLTPASLLLVAAGTAGTAAATAAAHFWPEQAQLSSFVRKGDDLETWRA